MRTGDQREQSSKQTSSGRRGNGEKAPFEAAADENVQKKQSAAPRRGDTRLPTFKQECQVQGNKTSRGGCELIGKDPAM